MLVELEIAAHMHRHAIILKSFCEANLQKQKKNTEIRILASCPFAVIVENPAQFQSPRSSIAVGFTDAPANHITVL